MVEEDMIRITPDKERAKSILEMVELREKRLNQSKNDEFATLLLEDYYEIIKELSTALINLGGYKTLSHKILFDYLRSNYKIFSMQEMELIDELRKTRNKVVYEGFFIKPSYLKRNESIIKNVILKLKNLVSKRI